MSSEDTKKHWSIYAPGILTGAAALIAALTTVYINLRNDNRAAAPATVQAAPLIAPTIVTALPVKPALPTTQTLDLKLDRLRVDNDGSMGTTAWTFDISMADRSLFSVPFKTLSDDAGENLVKPSEPDIAHAKVVLTNDQALEIVVRGWKQSWAGKKEAPHVIGKAKLTDDGTGLVIEAKSEKASGPAFVLYFSAQAVQN